DREFAFRSFRHLNSLEHCKYPTSDTDDTTKPSTSWNACVVSAPSHYGGNVMAITVQSTNSIGAGTRITLGAATDTLVVLPGVTVASNDTNDAVSGSVVGAFDLVENSGTIVGYDAIFIGATPSTLNVLNT